jgi:hypothetical protein
MTKRGPSDYQSTLPPPSRAGLIGPTANKSTLRSVAALDTNPCWDDFSTQCLDLYLLVNSLQNIPPVNRIIALFCPMFNMPDVEQPTFDFMSKAYEGTAPGSSLRKVLVDAYAARLDPADFALQVDRYPPGFVADLAVKLLHQTTIQIFMGKHEDYHEAEQ